MLKNAQLMHGEDTMNHTLSYHFFPYFLSNIFMAKVETEILNQSALKPLIWKQYIDDIFSALSA